ncbi:MAG: FAD-dependent oxidoreductase [Nitriliruptoraceae bacterium]
MRIAVVGSGIAGLASAWLLSRRHDVVLLERDNRLGGHTHTVDVDGHAIDTGFIVYNETTYPLLTRLFAELGVATQPSDMSWSVHCVRCNLEYAGSPGGVFAQPRRLADSGHWGMLAEIVRFNRIGRRDVDIAAAHRWTVRQLADAHGLSPGMRRHYLYPMAAAIWSSGTADVDMFPAAMLLRFFDNHGLLRTTGHLQWRTVTGGASRYVDALVAPLGSGVHRGLGAAGIVRDVDRVRIRLTDGAALDVDHVVIATHADVALALLDDATVEEKEALGVWRYAVNRAVLHTDATVLPSRRAARAAWNYRLEDCSAPQEQVSLSYGMNRLQSLASEDDYVVTLNGSDSVAPASIRRRMDYRHPVFTQDAVDSQSAFAALNGPNRTSFAGAYQRYGFHEDGLWSAVRVARQLGVVWPT